MVMYFFFMKNDMFCWFIIFIINGEFSYKLYFWCIDCYLYVGFCFNILFVLFILDCGIGKNLNVGLYILMYFG